LKQLKQGDNCLLIPQFLYSPEFFTFSVGTCRYMYLVVRGRWMYCVAACLYAVAVLAFKNIGGTAPRGVQCIQWRQWGRIQKFFKGAKWGVLGTDSSRSRSKATVGVRV